MQLAKYAQIAKDLPELKAIVVYGEEIDDSLAKKCGKAVFSFQDFLAHGEDVADAALKKRQDAIRPGNCSSLIYVRSSIPSYDHLYDHMGPLIHSH